MEKINKKEAVERLLANGDTMICVDSRHPEVQVPDIHLGKSDLRLILPDFVCDTLSSAIPKMLRLLNGVRLEDAMLFAAETRSSSPVRILRNKMRESLLIKGLFPAGEGAGYAGGIVSSAIDGLCAAEALIEMYYCT